MKRFTPFLVILVGLALAPRAQAQRDKYLRTNPKFVAAFREVVAKPSVSTVRILCDGKNTALGMIVGADGWILTKANDLKGTIVCELKDGRQFGAKLIGVHKQNDLAMLRIDAHDLVPVQFTSSKGVSAGSWVACAGINDDPVAIGVIGVATRSVSSRLFGNVDNAKSGFLGVSLEAADGGVKIVRIEPKTAAAKAGLKKDDIITALNGQNFTEVEPFINAMAKKKPGDVVKLKVLRDDEEKDVTAVLGKRPPNLSRGDFQNRMGSELSSRRGGYSTILQHDSVVKPTDCGGPIVDLDGHVIGINICRAGRTESWAVPSEAVETVLADLKSGKLAPPPLEPVNPKTHKVYTKEEKTKAIDELLGLMKKRLEVCALVARYKYVNKLPIADAKREERLLQRLLRAAEDEELNVADARAFFTAQFAASRKLQLALQDRWSEDEKTLPKTEVADLRKTLRPKLEQISMDLVDALAKTQPMLSDESAQELLRRRAREVLQSAAISEAVRNQALAGWLPN